MRNNSSMFVKNIFQNSGDLKYFKTLNFFHVALGGILPITKFFRAKALDQGKSL